jgi:hypothetical protein
VFCYESSDCLDDHGIMEMEIRLDDGNGNLTRDLWTVDEDGLDGLGNGWALPFRLTRMASYLFLFSFYGVLSRRLAESHCYQAGAGLFWPIGWLALFGFVLSAFHIPARRTIHHCISC